MKYSFQLLLTVFIVLTSCINEEVTVPADFVASKGTYIGVVHIAYGEIDGQAIVYRFNENNAEWNEISWTWSSMWADEGYLLPNGIIPGKEYRYKMQVYAEGQGDEFSEMSEEITGYAFKGDPVELTSVSSENTQYGLEYTIHWTNPNDLLEINNLQDIYYDVYRAENGNFTESTLINTLQEVVYNTSDITYQWTYKDGDFSLDPSMDYSYKIVTRYNYNYTNVNGDYRDNNYYTIDGEFVEGTGSGNGNGGNPIVEYTATDLGQVLAASSGVVKAVREKVIDNTLYAGAITDAAVYGTPALYRLNGSSWISVWSSVPDVEFDEINFAVSSTHSYLAGIRDSLGVFRYNGSTWSSNLTPGNLGRDDGPSAVSIEVFNDALYMAIEQHPDYHLQVLKYTGTKWDTIGGDANGIIATGSVYDPELQLVGETLYLLYRIDNTLYIKRLSGSEWVTDLQWEQEWLRDIELVRAGAELYFSSGSASSDFDGGVYHVTGTSSVTNLIPEEHEAWFTMGAFDLAADSDGNLIVASMKYEFEDESQTSLIFYPHLNVYDGTEWKTISGDFTDGVEPVTVSALDNDIYYIYGDADAVNEVNDPSVLKAKKFSK